MSLCTFGNSAMISRQKEISQGGIWLSYSLKFRAMRNWKMSLTQRNSFAMRHLKQVELSFAISYCLPRSSTLYSISLLNRKQISSYDSRSTCLLPKKLPRLFSRCSFYRYSNLSTNLGLAQNLLRNHSISYGREQMQRLRLCAGLRRVRQSFLNINYNSGKYLPSSYNIDIQIIMASAENEEEMVVPSILKANTSVGKNSFLRDMIGLKTLMEKRMEQRGLTLYYLSNKKFQSALIYCRQLTFSSMKIYKEYSDQYNDEFEENFFARTCKAKEHLEYLLDCIIACRVFIEAKKKEDAIDILEKVELKQNQKEKQVIVKTEADKVRFNEQNQIMSKMCAALLSFIEIAKTQKLYDYCQKYFKIYVNYVKNNYGIIEYSTALFKYGNYLYETKNYEASEENFKTCVEIRKNNVINSCLVDALLNLSICQRELAHYEQAIKNTKDAIQIYKDIKINDEGIDHYYLFLAKLLLQYAQFEEAYCNYLKCFKYRQQYDNSHPGKIEIELNMMMFYKILKDVTEKHREILNIEDKKVMEERRREATEVYSKMKNTILEREEFSKYRDFKSSRFSHLNLFISKDFFDSLSSNQIIELNSLLSKLGDLTFARGMAELQKCSFFEEKKLRDLLIETNGHLKKGHARKTNSEIGSSKAFI